MTISRCAWEDHHGFKCGDQAVVVIHVDEPASVNGTTGLPSVDRATRQYGACRAHRREMTEFINEEVQFWYNPVFAEFLAGDTGRTFIYDDLNACLVREAPKDHDEWAVWTEWRDEDGDIWYTSDHEGYTLDPEEFGPIIVY